MNGQRRAVVTGGNKGIGRTVVERLARDGYAVVATGRDREALADVAGVAAAEGWHVTTVACDVTDEAAVKELFAGDEPFDVLVANAGTADSAPVHRTSLELWERHLAVNATGVFLCLREALADMRSRGTGRAVVVASVAGLTGQRYTGAYAATKHAAIGLVRAAAREVMGTGITVNAVCPGWVRTDMTDRAVQRIVATTDRTPEEALEGILAQSGQPRLVEPEEVADAVAYLCGERAASVNGQTLVVDAGALQT